MRSVRGVAATAIGLGALLTMCGCPNLQAAREYIPGTTGNPLNLAATASVQVFSPQSDLAVTGGAPVEVNWRAVGTTAFAVVDVIIDQDTDPNNGNETVAFSGLPLSQTTETLDTTRLTAGTYFVGLRVVEVGEIVASGYAPGRLIINQRPNLYFTSPRDNFVYDRTRRINPSFDVAWVVSDPDSTVTVRVYLDPDDSPNGNEILLRESTSQTGDSFTFNLPTASFAAGTYRLLALVFDGVDTFPFYAPASIQLRGRLAGYVDLRDIDLPTSRIRGAVFEGFNPRDNAGSFLATFQDIDGDGFDDFLIVAQFGKPFYESNLQRVGVGEAYLIYGRSAEFSGVINLNSTGTLFRGEIYGGVPEVTDPVRPSRGITSFTTLTDWDRDGVREFAFGLPYTDSLTIGMPLDPSGYFRTGGVIVVAGSSLRPDLGFPGRNVFNLAEFGTLAHEACQIPPPECPQGFVGPKYSGVAGAGPSGTTIFHRYLVCPGDPRTGGIKLGCRFSSNDDNDNFGETISTGDFHSLIISAPNRDPFVSVLRANSVPGGGVVSMYYCGVFVPFFPWSIANAPPANATYNYGGSPTEPTGLDFLPRGGPYHYVLDDLRFFPVSTGVSVLASPGYWTSVDSPPCSMDDNAGVAPGTTVTFWSSTPGARLSNTKGIGDVNMDGLLDLLIGAPFANDGAGDCYIVLGRLRDIVEGGELEVEELSLPINSSDPQHERIFDGIRIAGAPGDRLGQAQDDAHDFNHDGLDDVVIGSPLINNRKGGAAVFFGSRDAINLTEAELPFDELPERGLGVIFEGEEDGDLAGARVAGVGDIDGDGNDDILIAAPDRSVRLDLDGDGTIDIDRTQCGVVYLVYGSPNLLRRLSDGTYQGRYSLSLVGTESLPGAVFIGRNSQDHLGAGLGEQGDRSTGIAAAGDVNGDGFRDLLLGSVSAAPRNLTAAGEAYLLYGTGD